MLETFYAFAVFAFYIHLSLLFSLAIWGPPTIHSWERPRDKPAQSYQPAQTPCSVQFHVRPAWCTQKHLWGLNFPLVVSMDPPGKIRTPSSMAPSLSLFLETSISGWMFSPGKAKTSTSSCFFHWLKGWKRKKREEQHDKICPTILCLGRQQDQLVSINVRREGWCSIWCTSWATGTLRLRKKSREQCCPVKRCMRALQLLNPSLNAKCGNLEIYLSTSLRTKIKTFVIRMPLHFRIWC